jgi:TRAP-type mannitol/chloroaromatic compound transport system permease small subunit
MKPLLAFCALMDWISERFGRIAAVGVLAAAMISAGNAIIRYGFDISSNAWLEIQWYMFAGTVMLGASLVLKLNEHVRVDILYGSLPTKAQVYLDIAGLVVFLLPVMVLMLYLSAPLFLKMFISKEMSSNAGGLIRWPAMLLLPTGFLLMTLQGVAEIIKRIAYLRGEYQMDTHYEKPVQ